jgi:hypothetical protein
MLCPSCGKESSNLRVCAHCQTPYPTDEAGHGKASRGTKSAHGLAASEHAAGDSLLTTWRQSRTVRWSVIGLLSLLVLGYFIAGRERTIPVGVVVPNMLTAPMAMNEAEAFLNTVHATARVEVQGGELTVQISATAFPQRRAGQLTLAQQYSRADAIIQGHQRAIGFLDPRGNPFARAEPNRGVVMTR